MKTALLTGLTAFAVGATGTLALSGTGSATSLPTSRSAQDDDGTPDQGRGDVTTAPAPVRTAPGVKLRGDGTVDDTQPVVARSTATSTASARADDDGTADQGSGDR